ncbi:MAG TPA: hypothetical protein VFK52_04165 [Nocardioidaceae bacterium]|nr:hypothetical protein [Nocardioidaceae bacterium]
MDELEQLFRESFARHADEVDVSIAVPVKKGPSWIIPILAAAAAVTVVASGVMMLGDEDPESGEPQPAVVVPADWRVEQWRGVQVSVPRDWGWGGAPIDDLITSGRGTPGSLLDCGTAAFVDASGDKLLNGNKELPYVGRPLYMTDMCMSYEPDQPPKPTAPYVWLGAPIDEGTIDLGDGWTQETTKVAGESVTVATNDEALRRQILASAEPNDDTRCATSTDGVWPQSEGRLGSEPTRMDVCAYVQEQEVNSSRQLVYSTTIDAEATREFLDAVAATPDHQCIDSYNTEWVALRVHGEAGETQVFMVSLRDCIGIDDGKKLRDLTPDNVRPWAVDGIPAYLTGPSGPRLSPYFRGMLG